MWMKVDDRLHAHRKTRTVTRSHDFKRRDVAPMGLWVAAGSWSAQNATDGWVPEEELDRWDDDWSTLTSRLVKAGYWWPQEHNGEPGFGFNDWLDYNPESEAASRSGIYGNHVRWHANKGVVDPDCEHCPKEPESDPDPDPESGGDIGGRSGGESGQPSQTIALPVPDPTPTRTEPEPILRAPRSATNHPERFEEFWDTYDKKRGRKAALAKYRLALKKPGVTADLLIVAAAAYVTWERTNNHAGRYVMDAARWLNGEHWTDERVARAPEVGRVGQHMALVRQLAAEEASQPQIGPSR